jgi:cytochrome c oxidase subunit II
MSVAAQVWRRGMKVLHFHGAAIVLVLGGLCGAAAIAEEPGTGDSKAGSRWYVVCGACHGEHGEGIRALSVPRIAGLSGAYVIEQLDAFRTGQRGADPDDHYGQQMQPMAMLLPDLSAVADVAALIGAFPVTSAPASVSAREAQGRALYRSCAACHGDRAQGIESLHAPPLAGQDAAYLIRQLRAFRRKTRGGPRAAFPAQTMSAASAVLAKPQADEDVAAYIASLETKDTRHEP